MWMTEEENKRLWCPMTRLPYEPPMSRNKRIPDASRCVGDKCAMWYWNDSDPSKGTCAIRNLRY